MPKNFFDAVHFVTAYEAGDMGEDEVVEGFQALIDTGIVWSLQGHYGRTAAALIGSGHCLPQERYPGEREAQDAVSRGVWEEA